jgi:hypothetical protein
MKERPILFSGEMIRAILEGRKTQTRRVLKPEMFACDPRPVHPCPYGQPGDRLWVRETISQHNYCGFPLALIPQVNAARMRVWSYAADAVDEGTVTRNRPSIHMPRWASRLTLEIAKVRVERVQEISEADAIAEGCTTAGWGARQGYRNLWDTINGKRGFGWDANPWVWIVDFKPIIVSAPSRTHTQIQSPVHHPED